MYSVRLAHGGERVEVGLQIADGELDAADGVLRVLRPCGEIVDALCVGASGSGVEG